jgi:peptidoglycan/xylan/chitin deacetylase (PgdA/CDA1 family)
MAVKQKWRLAAFRVLQAAGLMALWRWRNRRSVNILMLHGVMDGDDDSTTWSPVRSRLSRRDLARALEALSRHYEFATLTEAVQMLAGKRPFRNSCVVLTFDDGYRNNLTHALPVLRQYGAPATFFLPTGKITERSLFAFDRLDYALQHVEGDSLTLAAGALTQDLRLAPPSALVSSFADLRGALKDGLGADVEYCEATNAMVQDCERRAGRSLNALRETDAWSALMTWKDVETLAAEPLAEIGSHTVDHTRLGLAAKDTIGEQLRDSKREIEARTGRVCRHFAYPNGSYSPEAAALTRLEGYESAVTTDEGPNEPGADPMTLRRFSVASGVSPTEVLATVCGLADSISALLRVLRSIRSRARGTGPRLAPAGEGR